MYDAGNAHAAWRIGKAFLKVKIFQYSEKTRELVTLEAVKRTERTFHVPEIPHQYEFDGRSYLVVSEVPRELLQGRQADHGRKPKVQLCREYGGLHPGNDDASIEAND